MSMKNKFRTLFSVDEEEYYEEVVDESSEEPIKSRSNKHDKEQMKNKKENVVSLQSVQSQAKVVLSEPRRYDEIQEIADHVVNRRSVVINLQRVSKEEAMRIVDFLSGTVYAVSGDIQKLGPHTFLCTPDNVEIQGAISSLTDEDYDEQGRY
ncbi:cell division protein SepF [Halolactibacillus alkaliphilus]|uniref:Cell division protein SepF n=1 Tax=Halolactibacillus alkaliphilus TaxID=442899 RepID=A0A511WX71_9BACI|nr:cell division protein SepF [Halolactibacillus alkaliphilus]GEN55709.1 cell division protein SepF [Halolactibacillus alkaliphilus]GGN65306.1 cell division protein SepF [Halolactibacillus alkaliphilus]SFO63968.1 cell division inhibitor SepF [Halolactibacillus alkaliphilus]